MESRVLGEIPEGPIEPTRVIGPARRRDRLSGRLILDYRGDYRKTGKPVTRAAVRDAIQSTKLKTLQGEVSFDENGDLTNRIVSIFQVRHDAKYPPDDLVHQYKYVGAAPQETT